jgi:hypothetical protein
MTEYYVHVSGAQHTGDLEAARSDLRSSGAKIQGSESANYQEGMLYFRVEIADLGDFQEKFEKTATFTKAEIMRVR